MEEKKLSKLILDETTGDVIDSSGKVVFNIKKQRPHEKSQIISFLHKVWDFFDLSDEKVLDFIKRNTIQRFKKRKADFDLESVLDNEHEPVTEKVTDLVDKTVEMFNDGKVKDESK